MKPPLPLRSQRTMLLIRVCWIVLAFWNGTALTRAETTLQFVWALTMGIALPAVLMTVHYLSDYRRDAMHAFMIEKMIKSGNRMAEWIAERMAREQVKH